MARKFTKWGGVRINTNKTPQQIVDQLNRTGKEKLKSYVSNDTFHNALSIGSLIGHSSALKRYGIEFNQDEVATPFSLNRKGQMNSQTPIAAMGGTNG